jgi:hypothetical protein
MIFWEKKSVRNFKFQKKKNEFEFQFEFEFEIENLKNIFFFLKSNFQIVRVFYATKIYIFIFDTFFQKIISLSK